MSGDGKRSSSARSGKRPLDVRINSHAVRTTKPRIGDLPLPRHECTLYVPIIKPVPIRFGLIPAALSPMAGADRERGMRG